jgi:hypothetical protein
MPRYVIQRVQEVVLEARNYPQAVKAMKQLTTLGYWDQREGCAFVLPGECHQRAELRMVGAEVEELLQKAGFA